MQDQSKGEVSVIDVPDPMPRPEGLLVETIASVISSGTERSKIEMGEKSLLGKARARPDLARKVVDQVRSDGLGATLDLVKDRLESPQPLGYSAVGRVRAVGTSAGGFEPGDLVAIAGAGYANHAELNYVPANLAAKVPEGVQPADAAFATLASIALHGIRQAQLTSGELVIVAGLGLIGQLTVRLLAAYGHPVIGVDPSETARQEVEAADLGTCYPPDAPQLQQVHADAVLLAAATSSDSLVHASPTWCRDRGRVVVVGDVGLSLEREHFYEREIELRFSRSYGPGRYDSAYEEEGHDYPIGYVRWTEQRNLAEFLRLLESDRLNVSDLIDATWKLEEAPTAYERLANGPRARAMVLEYAPQGGGAEPTRCAAPIESSDDELRISLCGAGNFARKTLIPAFEATGRVQWGYVCTENGLSARHVATKRRFTDAVGTAEEAMREGINAVVIASRHSSHGELAKLAADRGLYAYVEKPLCITEAELEAIEASSGAHRLTTGFNRRLAPATVAVRDALAHRQEPASLRITVNAGRLAVGHWSDTAAQGGRLIGELCHFIDLACHLVQSPMVELTAAGAGLRAPEVEDNVQVLARHVDGSTSSIAYFPSGARNTPKERIEIHADGISVVIDDFRRWSIANGKRTQRGGKRQQDKGHRALVSEFTRFAVGEAPSPVPFHQAAHVTRATLDVIRALEHGDWRKMPAMQW